MQKLLTIGITAFLMLGGCSFFDKKCPDGMIDWVEAAMWKDVKYTKNYEADISGIERDKKIGEVSFKMSEVVCSDYRMKNGDATLAEIGTPIYSVKGYSEQYRIFVGEDLYEVTENPHAKTIDNLYDIKGKVKSISFESTVDGSLLSSFTDEATNHFTEEFLKLKYVGFDSVYPKICDSDKKYFLRFYLEDGSSFLESYWSEANVISPGAFATERMKEIVMSHQNKRVFPYPELLSQNEKTYHVLVVNDLDGSSNHKLTEIMNKSSDYAAKMVSNSKETLPAATMITNWNNARKKYPALSIVSTPAVIIFDSKGIVLKTYDVEEGLKFFEDRLSSKK